MPESKFLLYVLTESILQLCLGFGILILPKITIVSFGLMMSIVFLSYGIFKIIYAIKTKNFSRHYILDIILGSILTLNGLLLSVAPILDIMLVIGLAGIYFSLKSVSTSAFAIQTRKILYLWRMGILLSVTELLFGIITIIFMPSAALWLIGVLAGLDFILSGIIYMNMYILTKYIHS